MYRKFIDQVDNRTKGAGILPLCIETGRFLLIMRNDGAYSTVGGHLTWGEKFAHAAIREFHEETLYDGSLILLRGFSYHSPVKNFQYINYVGLVPHEFIPNLDEENSHYDWFTLSQLYGGELPFLNEFELFLMEARPLIDNIFKGLGIFSI